MTSEEIKEIKKALMELPKWSFRLRKQSFTFIKLEQLESSLEWLYSVLKERELLSTKPKTIEEFGWDSEGTYLDREISSERKAI